MEYAKTPNKTLHASGLYTDNKILKMISIGNWHTRVQRKYGIIMDSDTLHLYFAGKMYTWLGPLPNS